MSLSISYHSDDMNKRLHFYILLSIIVFLKYGESGSDFNSKAFVHQSAHIIICKSVFMPNKS